MFKADRVPIFAAGRALQAVVNINVAVQRAFHPVHLRGDHAFRELFRRPVSTPATRRVPDILFAFDFAGFTDRIHAGCGSPFTAVIQRVFRRARERVQHSQRGREPSRTSGPFTPPRQPAAVFAFRAGRAGSPRGPHARRAFGSCRARRARAGRAGRPCSTRRTRRSSDTRTRRSSGSSRARRATGRPRWPRGTRCAHAARTAHAAGRPDLALACFQALPARELLELVLGVATESG